MTGSPIQVDISFDFSSFANNSPKGVVFSGFTRSCRQAGGFIPMNDLSGDLSGDSRGSCSSWIRRGGATAMILYNSANAATPFTSTE